MLFSTTPQTLKLGLALRRAVWKRLRYIRFFGLFFTFSVEVFEIIPRKLLNYVC